MTFEDFERGLVAAVVVAFVLADVALLFWNRPASAEKHILSWARSAWLPRDDAAFADAVRRHIRQQRLRVIGSLLGVLAASPALIADFGFIGMSAWLAGASIGQLVGGCLAYAGAARGRVRRASAAAGQPRTRLRPAELVVLCGAPLAPAMLLVVGCAVLDDPEVGPAAVVAVVTGAVLLLVDGGVVLAVRRLLALESAADSQSAGAWEEAHRAQSLRDLISAPAMAAYPVLMVGTGLETYRTGVAPAVATLSIAAVLIGMGVVMAAMALQTTAVRPRLENR